MGKEQLFATFILNGEIEIAIPADRVVEAIKAVDKILPVPGCVDYLEGLMNLRGRVIPVINLKKRLAMADNGYGPDHKIAFVRLGSTLCGILVEDIKDVLRVRPEMIEPILPSLLGDDRIVSGIIRLDDGDRLLEILDLNLLLDQAAEDEIVAGQEIDEIPQVAAGITAQQCRQYLVFTSNGMEYGVDVNDVQEITTLSGLNDTFQSGSIEGAVELRGRMIPIVDSNLLLTEAKEKISLSEEGRVIILLVNEIYCGVVVNSIVEIRSVAAAEVVPVPCSKAGKGAGVAGMLHLASGRNIMLLDMETMLADELEELGRVANMSCDLAEDKKELESHSHHLITENSYLIFKVERDFAIALHNVQEILENCRIMPVPAMGGFLTGIIDLRGQMVPVVSLRLFFGYDLRVDGGDGNDKYVIAQSAEGRVALAVDDIVTIQKQQKYFQTPALNPKLRPRQDTLDRTIELITDDDLSESVLVINIENLIGKHLEFGNEKSFYQKQP
ncbi:MAG: chemotaxis protein CheW [Proteobacteria bacterium]|nr:chemotaxis protein CheW [Pseudomonadota bacterium]